MSNQQWPGPPSKEPNPWSTSDPNWAPPTFEEHAGRDPRLPFGAESRPSAPVPQVDTPHKLVWPWIVGVIGVVAVLLIVLVIQPSPSEPNPSELPASSRFPSPSVTGNAIPYEGNGNGMFTITRSDWTDYGLELDYRISTESGNHEFAFFVFINYTRNSYVPEGDPVVRVSSQAQAQGTLRIFMPRGDTTVVLTTAGGRAITALPIKG